MGSRLLDIIKLVQSTHKTLYKILPANLAADIWIKVDTILTPESSTAIRTLAMGEIRQDAL